MQQVSFSGSSVFSDAIVGKSSGDLTEISDYALNNNAGQEASFTFSNGITHKTFTLSFIFSDGSTAQTNFTPP